MNMKKFLEATDPEMLQKFAEAKEEDLLEKLLPLLEKTANYTAYLVMEKMAEAIEGEVPPGSTTPATGNRTNDQSNPTRPTGLNIQQVHDAICEAIGTGNSGKIVPFVDAIAKSHPDAINEVIKAVKVELHDGLMKGQIDEEIATQISSALNSMAEA